MEVTPMFAQDVCVKGGVWLGRPRGFGVNRALFSGFQEKKKITTKKQQNEMKLLEWTLKKRNKVETGFGKTKWKEISQSSEETVGDS